MYMGMIRLALYQPDIPQNTGAAMRLCACLGVGLDIIEPCGFVFDNKKIRKSGMDYIDMANMNRHSSWKTFTQEASANRIILMTTKADTPYTSFRFEDNDILLAGSESAGVPEDIHQSVQNKVIIPMQNGARSLNVINASAMILGEALRQIT